MSSVQATTAFLMLDPLRSLLARYPPDVQPLSEAQPLGNAGGRSGARLWRFDAGRGRLVARAWPGDGPDVDCLRTIHGWLFRARNLPFVAAPLPDIHGQTVHELAGRLWQVEPWMPGSPDLERPPSGVHLRAASAVLAMVHVALGVESMSGPSPGLAARIEEMDRLLRGEFESLRHAVDANPNEPHRELALRWLDVAPSRTPGLLDEMHLVAARHVRLQPCLRDARPDHFLFEGDRLTGLVDFGAMGIEAVSADLARLLSEWIGADRVARSEALSAYAGIRPLDGVESPLISAFERSAALLGGARWIRWHFRERRRFDDPGAVARALRTATERLAVLAAGDG